MQKTRADEDQQDLWIKSQIQAGLYTNDSDCTRDLVSHEQERGTEIESIRSALIEGENSGEPRQLDVAAFKRRMRTHG